MERILLLPLCALLSIVGRAQDSTHYVLGGNLRVTGMGGLIVQVGDMGIGHEACVNVGGGGGILFGQHLMLGGYGQGLARMAYHHDFVVDGYTREGTLSFGHGGIWTMWSFKPKQAIHPFVGMQVGWGTAEWVFNDPYDSDEGTVPDSLRTPPGKHDEVFVLTPSVGAEFNVVRWFRPNVYVGYTFVSGLKLEGTRSGDLNGFFFGMNLLFGGFGER